MTITNKNGEVVELRDFALQMVEFTKRNLTEGTGVLPTILAIRSDSHEMYVLKFANYGEKRAMYAQAMEKILERGAPLAILTINDVWTKSYPVTDSAEYRKDRATYKDVEHTPGRTEALVVLLSPLEADNVLFVQHYHREEDKIIFDQFIASDEEEVNSQSDLINQLIPDGWKQHKDTITIHE